MRVATSFAAVFPPQTAHRKRHHARRGVAASLSAGWNAESDRSAASVRQWRSQRRDRREGRQSLQRTHAGAPVPQSDKVQSERIRREVLGRDRTRRLCEANPGRTRIESAHLPRSERKVTSPQAHVSRSELAERSRHVSCPACSRCRIHYERPARGRGACTGTANGA